MNRLTVGTTNQAKVQLLAEHLAPFGITLEIAPCQIDIPEHGTTAQENARLKATTYATALNAPAIATDDALYFEGFATADQPGLNVRRIPGGPDRASDEELIAYYASLFARYGDRVTGWWEWAICIATPDGQFEEVTLTSPPRHFTSNPCEARIPGFPLESFTIDPDSGGYRLEQEPAEDDVNAEWTHMASAALCEMVGRMLAL